jgi:hypothetical protein
VPESSRRKRGQTLKKPRHNKESKRENKEEEMVNSRI